MLCKSDKPSIIIIIIYIYGSGVLLIGLYEPPHARPDLFPTWLAACICRCCVGNPTRRCVTVSMGGGHRLFPGGGGASCKAWGGSRAQPRRQCFF